VKFVLACWGSRGDLEPCVAVGRELQLRGHDVRMAVPPDQIGFAEKAGLAAVAYGVDWSASMVVTRKFLNSFYRKPWRIPDLISFVRDEWEVVTQCWGDMSSTLMSLADGADLLLTGQSWEEQASNVAEHYKIPLTALHYNPVRANSYAVAAYEALYWRLTKKLEDAQRRELGLPKATSPAPRRITERGSLELQAYDEACFPGLAAAWAKFDGRQLSQRPFVGALTLQWHTDVDEEIAAWIAEGTPPISFGFGSIPVDSPTDTMAMIGAACAQLGERALVCSAGSDFTNGPRFEHVKVVETMDYAAIFPTCRAVVHRGGSGTTAAALRAGVPTLILWKLPDQRMWGTQVKRLEVGTARRFSTATEKRLVADLRTILAPQYVAQAREFATRMTDPSKGVAAAADHVEKFARLSRVG